MSVSTSTLIGRVERGRPTSGEGPGVLRGLLVVSVGLAILWVATTTFSVGFNATALIGLVLLVAIAVSTASAAWFSARRRTQRSLL